MAQSDDIYVRKDVFDAKMEAFMAEIRLGNAEIKKDIELLDQKFEAKFDQLANRLEDRIATVNVRIDDLHTRISSVQMSVYFGFTMLMLALLVMFIVFVRAMACFLEDFSKPHVSFEDVERLINQAIKPKS
ncbi:MAG: hypothetical protein IJ520_06970 [Synergistaceae bacterium]|nr:hypothetical protein [Synergistaceae bacterium]